MSTRSQLGFYEKKPTNVEHGRTAMIYRHSDGYPFGTSGVLADIVPFLKGMMKYRRLDQADYVAAQVLHCLIAKHYEWMKETKVRHEKENKYNKAHGKTVWPYHMEEYQYIGFGIDNNFHGDIEYFYAIYPNGIDVYEVTDSDNLHKQDPRWSIDLTKVKAWKHIREDIGHDTWKSGKDILVVRKTNSIDEFYEIVLNGERLETFNGDYAWGDVDKATAKYLFGVIP